MFDKYLLKPMNQCPYTSLERRLKSPNGRVKMYEDIYNRQIRLVYSEFDNPLSGLLIKRESYTSKVYTIQGVYTVKERRRENLAKSLLAVARMVYNVKHSEYLTEEGKKFAKVG